MIFWRYLFTQYIKLFFLTITFFILILLISRVEEIAKFIALGAKLSTILLFIAHQIPYMLPIAGALASLLASFTLFQRLSVSNELTALRASGLSLHFIATPLLISGVLFSCFSFCLASEYSTTSHLKTRQMVHDLLSVNPLLLLTQAKGSQLKGAYIHIDPAEQGKKAKELFVAFYNSNSQKIHYILAKELETNKGELIATHATLLGSSDRENSLYIENQEKVIGSADELAKLLKSKGWKIANDHLNLKLLRIRKQEFKQEMKLTQNQNQLRFFKKKIAACDSEIIRRISIALNPFTFTFMGIAYGIHISRRAKRIPLLIISSLTIFSLISFFAGMEFVEILPLASLLFSLPHVIILFLSGRAFNHLVRGIE